MLTLQILMSRVFLKFIFFSFNLRSMCVTSVTINLKQIKKFSSIFYHIYYKIVTIAARISCLNWLQSRRIQWFSGFQQFDIYPSIFPLNRNLKIVFWKKMSAPNRTSETQGLAYIEFIHKKEEGQPLNH